MPEKTPTCLLTSLFAMLSLSLVVVIFGEQNLRIFVLGWEWFHCAVLLWGAWSWSRWSWCLLLYLFRPPIIRPSVYRKVTALWSVRVPSRFSCVQLCDPVDCSPPGSSVHGVSRQQYWGGLPCPPPGDLPDPGTEPTSLMSKQMLVLLYLFLSFKFFSLKKNFYYDSSATFSSSVVL